MKARDAWQLARGSNALMAGIGTLAGGVVAVPYVPDVAAPLGLAALAAASIAAAGNVLNDYVDRDLDRTAHPNRPLAAGRVDRKQSERFLFLLAAAGFLAAYFAGGWLLFGFAIVNLLLLIGYEKVLKAQGLPGNIAIAALVASTFPFGAIAARVPLEQWTPIWALVGMAFFANFARELLKDLEDVAADAATRRTFPMRAGRKATLWLAGVLCAFAAASSWPLLKIGWPHVSVSVPIYLVLGADAMVLAAPVLATRGGARIGQIALKLAMATALLAVAVQAWWLYFSRSIVWG